MAKQISSYKFHLNFLQQTKFDMKIKSNWTQQEDQFVKSHVKQQKRKNWVKVSQLLNDKFPDKQRTSKQCRQRYINYSRIQSKPEAANNWSKEETEFLLKIFEKEGPKWTKISKLFPERTQNQVKNKFYCLLRKFVRKMNFEGNNMSQKLKKQIKYKSVFRILNSEWSLTTLPENLSERAKQIRCKIFSYVRSDPKIERSESIEEIIESINHFNLQTRSYRSMRPKRYESSKEESMQMDQFQKQQTKQISKQKQEKPQEMSEQLKGQVEKQKIEQKKQNILSEEQIAKVYENSLNEKNQYDYPQSLLDDQINSPLDRYFLL